MMFWNSEMIIFTHNRKANCTVVFTKDVYFGIAVNFNIRLF